MLRIKCCAAVLAAMVAGTTPAATIGFTYQGFLDDASATWLPDYTLSGSFTGTDNNSDGIISLAELTRFRIADYDILGSPDCPNPGVGLNCRLAAFSYSLTGTLAFNATWSYSDEVLGSFREWVAGDRIEYASYNPSGSTYQTLYWTGDTVLTLSPPPVPEPSIAAMAGVGALLLTGLRRRRRGR